MTNRGNQPVESGDPSNDLRMFRRCLGQFGTGVAVITARMESMNVGVTVNSLASVSLDPPLVLWSISRQSRSFEFFQRASAFVINILRADEIELSRHFSSSVEDKFAGIEHTIGELGIPVLDGAVAHIECKKEMSYEGGDHVILIGRAIKASRFAGEPLLFVQGRYVVAADHPEAPQSSSPESKEAPVSDDSNGLIPLLFETHHALSAKFDDHRRAEGLGVVPARILATLYDSAGLSAEDIARKNYLGVRDAEDALCFLVNKAQIALLPNGKYALTELGQKMREAIKKRWLDFQSQETSGISLSDIRIASGVLEKLLSKASLNG